MRSRGLARLMYVYACLFESFQEFGSVCGVCEEDLEPSNYINAISL